MASRPGAAQTREPANENPHRQGTLHWQCSLLGSGPDLYQLDDEGYIASEGFDVPPGQEDLARRGARACPERVIEIVAE